MMRRLLLTILILCAAAAAQAQRYRLPAFEGEQYIDTSTIIDTTAVTIEGSSQGAGPVGDATPSRSMTRGSALC
ncbi:MAG: hypothetical protein L6V80_05270 [Bacteroidales bacterium]|nr:MAG: hypothetical protein L6V80_05270 [Bacteroidales bacterium]